MLNENIKNLRKNRGLTQEALAAQLNVVRQTVSKWEKGLSVPDAEMLQKLADVLETDVRHLLGVDCVKEAESSEVAEQLARINEQLVIKNRRARRIWKIVGIAVVLVAALQLLALVLGCVAFGQLAVDGGNSVPAIVEETEIIDSTT